MVAVASGVGFERAAVEGMVAGLLCAFGFGRAWGERAGLGLLAVLA